MLLSAALLVGCFVPPGALDTGPADDTDVAPSDPGHPPDAPVPLPTFSATSHLGEARGPEDLVGHPTVMWFFPVVAGAG